MDFLLLGLEILLYLNNPSKKQLLNKNIKIAIQELKKAQIAKSLLAELRKEEKLSKAKLEALSKEIQSVDSSINLLTDFSLEYLLKQLSGKRTDELEIRKEHYLNLSLQYNEHTKALKLLEYEISVLKSKAKNISGKKEELQNLILASEENLIDGNVSLYRKKVKELRSKIELANEIDEAIIQGVKVNKLLNKTLRYLKSLKDIMQEFKHDHGTYRNYRIDRLDRYENYITQLQLEFLKFKKEYNDVHKRFFSNITYSENIVNNFLKEIRRNLISDIRGNKGLKNSIHRVTNIKSNVMSLTRSLRSDVRKIEKEIQLLEKEEKELMSSIAHDE